MERITALGLDVGKKRIGIAGCDKTGLVAAGLMTLERTCFAQDCQQLQAIVREREITILVIGLPYNLDGSLGFQAKQVQKFARRLAETLQLPVEYVDERLTSVEAENQLKAQKRFSSYNKGMIDQQAAQIILQQWLDQRRQLKPPRD